MDSQITMLYEIINLFKNASYDYVKKQINNNQDIHANMVIDKNCPIGYVANIANHIGKNPSGHWYLRNAIICVIEYDHKYKTLSTHIEKVGGYSKLQQNLCRLNKKLYKELKEFFDKYNLFDLDCECKPEWASEDKAASTSKKTLERWTIEKEYLEHWLNEGANGNIKSLDGNFFVNWETDGERLGFLYYKNCCISQSQS